MTTIDYTLGCRMPLADLIRLNRDDAFAGPKLMSFVAPFPPRDLMQNVSGLVSQADFASHGTDFFIALTAASPKPFSDYRSIFDFGCGVERLARLFKGHPGRVAGCDIDHRHVECVDGNLDFVEAKLSTVKPPIQYQDGEFEAVISISIFTHLNEATQDLFLADLARVTAADGLLFLTVHGERALQRANNESAIRAMIDVPDGPFKKAKSEFAAGQHAFILQDGHLTTTLSRAAGHEPSEKVVHDDFEYGITFVPEAYVRSHWARWFEVVDYRSGALHDFQDLVVLRPRTHSEIRQR